MIDTSLHDYIQQYLEKATLMQVATSHNNQPWACTVYFAFDEKLRLYWISTPSRRHSEEIRLNNKVAGVIVLPHTPGDKVRGLQFQGSALELQEKEKAALGLGVYAKRFGMGQERLDAIVNGTDGHMLYKIEPSIYVLFDEVHFPQSPRQELLLGKISW